jgi:hypothetical protein
MVTTTDEQKTTPPEDQWAKEICRIGQGKDCCRFLTMAPTGWSCEKTSSFSDHLTTKASLGLMVAISDNCEGRGTR